VVTATERAGGNCNGTGASCKWQSGQLLVHDTGTSHVGIPPKSDSATHLGEQERPDVVN
jgi:hypothetical protein